MEGTAVNLTFLQALGDAIGVPIGLMPIGRVFWVDDDGGGEDSTRQGAGSFETPFLTLAYAITRCKANRFDLVLLKPGHYEAVLAADLDLSVAATTIVGLGSFAPLVESGDSKGCPQIELQRDGELLISGASVRVFGLQVSNSGNPATYTLVNMVNVTGSGVVFAKNVVSQNGAAQKAAVGVLVAGDSAFIAHNRVIKLASSYGTKATHGISVTGSYNLVVDNEIYTDASVSPLSIGTAGGNTFARNRTYNVSSVNADTFMNFGNASDWGVAAFNRGFVGRTDAIHGSAISIDTFVTSAAMGCCQNFLVNEAGESGGLTPTAVSA